MINLEINANFTAVVVLSMALTPLVVLLYKRIAPKPTVNMDGVDEADGLSGSVLLIGFGTSARSPASRCWRATWT